MMKSRLNDCDSKKQIEFAMRQLLCGRALIKGVNVNWTVK